MKMRGKIVQAGKCIHCTGRYALILPEGEKNTRLFHSDPWCKAFKRDPKIYMRLHTAFAAKKKKDKKV
jgi:hypothetical protein